MQENPLTDRRHKVLFQKKVNIPDGPNIGENIYLGGGNSNMFYFHPEPWGKWSNLTSIVFKCRRVGTRGVGIFTKPFPLVPLAIFSGFIYHANHNPDF